MNLKAKLAEIPRKPISEPATQVATRKVIAKKQRSSEPTETDRVLSLPIVSYTGNAIEELLRVSPGKGELKLIQRQALEALALEGGGLFPVGVGAGKTLISLLAPTVVDADRAVILAPSQTLDNVAQERERFAPIFHIVPNITLLAYEKLSREKGLEEFISSLGSQSEKVIVVCDEAHKLKRFQSSRTKRVKYIAEELRPDLLWLFLSGTITSKSIYDFAHLAKWSLGNRAPIPLDRAHLAAWAECIDVTGQPGPMQWSYVYSLWNMFGPYAKPNQPGANEKEAAKAFTVGSKGLFESLPVKLRKEQVRYCFQARLHSAPGVVASTEASIKNALYIHALTEKDLPVPDSVAHALKMLRETGERPDGVILGDPKDLAETERYLSAGFFYRWAWPNEKRDEELMDARQEWNRQLRAELTYRSRPGYDSALLVQRKIQKDIELGTGTRAIHEAWKWWEKHRHKPLPPTVAVWLDYYLIDYAVTWLRKSDDTAMLWYQSQAVEKELAKRGVVVYGSGRSPVPVRETLAHRMAASVGSHGIGKNMHQWQSALVIEPTPDAVEWQQLIARLHRPECEHDEIDYYVPVNTKALRDTMKKAKERADYSETTGGETHRLNLATWVGLPGGKSSL